jgi:CRISPR-associated protein (TIGR03986 family)
MKSEGFLNPYTFIPAFPRTDLPEPLRDGPPPSRDRLHADRWSGRIEVTLTTETPLLLPDTARARQTADGAADHQVFPVRLRDGRPHLSATAVKGMLRAAFEAATNSRLGVFHGHDTPLAFRRDAGYARDMVPVYVAGDGVLYEFRTALLEMYDKDGNQLMKDAPRHMQRLRAVIKSTGQNQAKVVDFAAEGATRPLRAGWGERPVDGIAYVTGPTIERKRYERFFYKDKGKPVPLTLAREWTAIVADWDRLIRSYRDVHDDNELRGRRTPDGRLAGPHERIGEGPGQLAWSPHIYDAARMALRPATLCYARRNSRGEVERLYPVLIPRDLYPVSPADLLDKSLLPAPSYLEMSPADRVFGWVAPNGRGTHPAAYKGRIRIGPVTCADTRDEAVREFAGDGLPLAILSAPKPQGGRFYVAESATRPDQPVKDATPRAEIYRQGRALRGRKTYWHHAGLDAAHRWEVSGTDPAQVVVGGRYREHLRPRTPLDASGPLTSDRRRYATLPTDQRDSQNRSIGGWVVPKTTFHFVIEVRDVDDHELGALTWLLTLPPGHFHRLGLGRPLGFGSVRLRVEHAELHLGADYEAYYRSLSAVLPARDWCGVLNAARQKFDGLVQGSSALTTIREAMLTASRGIPDLPVHYPRVRPPELHPAVPTPPDPRANNYKWFTANEQLDGSTSARGRGRSLPPPVISAGPLQIYPAERGRFTLKRK